MSDHPHSPVSTQELGDLITDIKNSITKTLADLMLKMLNESNDKLFSLAEESTSNAEQETYYTLMRRLGDLKPEVSAEFITKIHPLLRPYTVTKAEEEAHKLEDQDELSLVDQAVMDDMVLVKNIGGYATGKFREQISQLEARLEHLALKTPDIFAKDALNPIKICQAFDDALGERFELPEKKILFDLFNTGVASKLDTLYDDINDKLITAGILPEIRLHTKSTPARRQPPSSPPPGEDAPPPQDVPQDQPYSDGGGPQSVGGYAMTAAPGTYRTGHHGTGAPGAGAAAGGHQDTGMPGGSAGAAPMPAGGGTGPAPAGGAEAPAGGSAGPAGGPTGPAPAGGAGPSMPAGGSAESASGPATTGGGFSGNYPPPDETGQYHHQTAGMPAGKVSQAISSFMGAPLQGAGAETVRSGGESPVYPASTPQHFGHDEILQALSSLQAMPEFEQPGELKFDAEAVKQALLQAIAKTSGGVVTKGINQIAEKTIDFIELVFDAIIEDEDISDTIKALLLRLQIPVIKASMLDQEFFIYDDHPARILLDKIAEVGVGITEHSDEIYVRLDKIVSQLISEYELDTKTFQKALDKLNSFIEEREEAARKKEEEAQQQALREHARNTVLKALRGITAGKTLPEAIHALVLKRWPTLMFNHYLNAGKENDEWVAILECLRDIIDSVQPLRSAQELAYLIEERDSLIERAESFLSKMYKSRKDIRFVIDGLIETHDDMIEDANFTEEEVQTAEEIITHEGPREKEHIEIEPAHVPRKPLPSNIMPGMWFQIYMGEDLPPRRCKLSVIIVEDEKLIFVTHEGELISEKSFEEFTGELDDEKSTVIMGHSVFDYALNSVITKLDPTRH